MSFSPSDTNKAQHQRSGQECMLGSSNTVREEVKNDSLGVKLVEFEFWHHH